MHTDNNNSRKTSDNRYDNVSVPRNVLLYVPRVYGIPSEFLLVLAFSSFIFLVLFYLIGLYSLLSFLIPVVVEINRKPSNRVKQYLTKYTEKILQRLRKSSKTSVSRNGKYVIVKNGSAKGIIIKISTEYDNGEASFNKLSKEIASLFKGIEASLTFYAIPEKVDVRIPCYNKDGLFGDFIYYRMFLVLWKRFVNEELLFDIINKSQHRSSSIKLDANLSSEEFGLLKDLFDKNYTRMGSYYSSKKPFTIFKVMDANKTMFPGYCEAIELSKTNCVVKFSMIKAPSNYTGIISRKLADIQYEIKEREKRGEKPEYLQNLVESASRIIEKGRSPGNYIVLTDLSFLVYSNNSMNLPRDANLFNDYIRMAGLAVRNETSYKVLSAKHFLDFSNLGKAYPMDLLSAASMTPIYFSKEETKGIFIGFNEANGKPFFFDPFSAPSYNIIVTGETGSGKSLFF